MNVKVSIPYIQMSQFSIQLFTQNDQNTSTDKSIFPNDPLIGYTVFPSNLSLYPPLQLKRFLLQAVQNNEMLHVRQILNHFKVLKEKQSIINIIDQPTFNNETKIFEILVEYEKAITSSSQIKNWLSQKNNDSFTPLHFAAYRGNIKILQMLKNIEVNFKGKNDQGRNCISMAAQSDQVATIVWLRINGVDYLEYDNKQATPLHWASYYGCENTLTLYLNWLEKENLNRRVINQQDLDGMSCLHLAVLSRNINIVRKLIQHGANKTIKDFKGRDPLQLAIDNNLKDVQLQIRKHNCLNSNNYNSNKPQKAYTKFLLACFLYFYCTFGTIFFTYPYLQENWEVQLSIILFGMNIFLFIMIIFLNPGYYPVSNDNEQLFNLYQTNSPKQICSYCIIVKPKRSRHCQVCQRCIKVYDHHCPWILNCIGARNLPFFNLYLIILMMNIIHVLMLNSMYLLSDYENLRDNKRGWFDMESKNVPFLAKLIIQLAMILICLGISVPLINLIYIQITNLLLNSTTFERLSYQTDQQNDQESGMSVKNCYIMVCKNNQNPLYE